MQQTDVEIDKRYLEQFDSYQEFRDRSAPQGRNPAQPSDDDVHLMKLCGRLTNS